MNDNKVKIYSYTKVWKVEKKIYSFSNLKLPIPINPYDLLYYGVVAMGVLALGKIFPFINRIPAVLRYLALPYLVATYMTKVKLDGKNPVKFFLSYIRYCFVVRKNYLQTFRRYPDRKKGKLRLHWDCSIGIQK